MDVRCCLASAVWFLVACSAEVRREPGDAAGGTGRGGGSAAQGGAGASAGDGGGAEAPYDPAEGCRVACDRDCTGNPARCQEDCLLAVEAGWLPCAAEAVALHACIGEACGFVDPDCSAEERALDRCHNVHACGAEIYDHTCGEPSDEACDCTAGCAEGHAARIVCAELEPGGEWRRDCDCYFDGELVGQCQLEGSSFGCLTDGHNCCEAFFVR